LGSIHARAFILVLLAGTSSSAVSAPSCAVAPSATLSFGPVVALASTGDVTTNTGSTFWINCTSDVTATPTLYSASPRTLISGASTLPFRLSAISAGGADLPAAPGGAPIGIARNGSNQTVPLYGKILAADFKGLPSGIYVGTITLTLEY
jgi:spore coat protein U-like protein